MTRESGHLPAGLAAAVASSAEALVLRWSRAEEGTRPRVSPSQLRVLMLVGDQQDMNLSQLAGELGAMPSSATRLCDRLVAADLLIRQTSERNRREVTLRLSTDGRRLLRNLEHSRQADLNRVLQEMPPKAREALLAGLEQFAAASARDQQPRERSA